VGEKNQSMVKESGEHIRIVGFNNDKTRKMDGSDVVYQVYIELSETPPQAWGMLFEREWKSLNATQPSLLQAASIDRGFLVMRCPLKEVVPMHLPFLRKAVAVTNNIYNQYVQELVAERSQREGVWERERSAVDAMTKPLRV
jgi:hypothetical protein